MPRCPQQVNVIKNMKSVLSVQPATTFIECLYAKCHCKYCSLLYRLIIFLFIKCFEYEAKYCVIFMIIT